MRTGFKAAFSISVLLLLSSFVFVPISDAASGEYSVELLKEDMKVLDPDTPMISKTLEFVTYTDENGTSYYLDKETVLTESTYYLRINADSGTFHVTVSVPSENISKTLRETGLEIRLTNGDEDCTAILDIDDGFVGTAMNRDAKAVLRPNIPYKVTILTAHEIEGDSQAEKTPEFSLRFEADPVDSYTVVFEDGGKVIETRMVEKDSAIGELPDPPARTGAEFEGWFDANGREWKATDIVTGNMILHTEWESGPLPPDPPGPPPTPHDKETKEEETVVEPDGTVITVISDLIERVDGTYDL